MNVIDHHGTAFLGVSVLWVDDRMSGFIFSLSIILLESLYLQSFQVIKKFTQ